MDATKAPTCRHRPLDDQALRWFMARRAPRRSAADRARVERAFRRWQSADTQRVAAYQRCVKDWQTLSPLAHRYLPPPSPALRPRRRQYWALAACLAVAALVGVIGLQWDPPTTDWQIDSRHAAIARLPLEDGSELAVDRRSALDIRFDTRRRAVQMHRGSVYFDVAHDAARAFEVETPQGTVRVLGTAFEVETGSRGLRVMVARGQVHVTHTGGTHALTAGDRLTLSPRGQAIVDSVPVERVADWRDGRVQFVDTPLDDVVRVLSRHLADDRIHLDPAVASLAVTLSVQLVDSRRSLTALASALPVRVYTLSDGLHIAPR